MKFLVLYHLNFKTVKKYGRQIIQHIADHQKNNLRTSIVTYRPEAKFIEV